MVFAVGIIPGLNLVGVPFLFLGIFTINMIMFFVCALSLNEFGIVALSGLVIVQAHRRAIGAMDLEDVTPPVVGVGQPKFGPALRLGLSYCRRPLRGRRGPCAQHRPGGRGGRGNRNPADRERPWEHRES